MTGLFDLMW